MICLNASIKLACNLTQFCVQIGISHDDMSRMQLEFIPMIQEIVFEWLIILFFGTTPSESPTLEDFSSQLSSLQIGKLFCDIK